MAITDDLSTSLKEAMKAKDKTKLNAIRQIQTEIAKKKAEKGEEATDELALRVISSYVKKMTKAVEEYQSLGERGEDMANQIQLEVDFLSDWLPEQLSEEDVSKLVDEVLSELGLENDSIFKLALRLEKIALEDDYFVEKKLYPNVDFYSGIVMRALGIPNSMFTAVFALARTAGWTAHWNEMFVADNLKIGRPRQIYKGKLLRNVSLDRNVSKD